MPMVSSNKLLYKEQSQIGQLICIILVMVHHWSQMLQLDGFMEILSPFKYVGGCACCGFFFFSGYGLFESYKKDSAAFIGQFIKKRFVKVLVPFIFSCIIYYLIWIFREDKPFDIYCFIISALGLNLQINGHFWFMQFLILLYISLYVSCLVAKTKKSQILLLLITNILLILVIGRTCGYMSSLGFSIGVAVSCINSDKLIKIDKGWLLVIIGIFVFCFYFAFYDVVLFKLTYSVALFAFLPLLICLSKKIKVSHYLMWLAKYSYYFYLTNAMSLIINSSALERYKNVVGLVAYLVLNMFIGILLKKVIDILFKFATCFKVSKR